MKLSRIYSAFSVPTRLSLVLCVMGCSKPVTTTPLNLSASDKAIGPHSEEVHLGHLRQLTFGGENAEAYWSFDGKQLIFQSNEGRDCDQIYRMALAEPERRSRISTGGATTCAYFLPGDREVIYASTHLAGAACPPKPDRSQGYVWPIYESYDIFRANVDGSNVRQLTKTPGYDAEATVCAKDGSVVFTSVRDGDLELYRMDADGKNVKRLTSTPGYDGGAFFNHDCSKLVWRASRPEGRELDDYRALLEGGLVRPGKLELFVANADGSEAMQVTYLDAASFAPYWYPSQNRIIFSSNYGDAKGREFDLWAVDADGTDLQRITFTPGFDGFPMFSPDGKWLVFGSNRATAPGEQDTNVFVARWNDQPPRRAFETAADRVLADIAWLADPAREGRGVGTRGLELSGEYIEKRFSKLGLAPAGAAASYRHEFDVVTSVKVEPATRLVIDGKTIEGSAFTALSFSAEGNVQGPLVFADYGISSKELGIDDYARLDARGKIVMVRRFVPDTKAFEKTEDKRRHGDLQHKAWLARERGAKALIVVDVPARPKDEKDWKPPAEAPFPALARSSYGDAGMPVAILKRATAQPIVERLSAGRRSRAELDVAVKLERQPAFNVMARLASTSAKKLPGTIVVGAHYDHIGMGGHYSLAPDVREPHVGADDNASGVAALIEVARYLKEQSDELDRDVVFIAFSAEESGLLGASHVTHAPPAGLEVKSVYAMLNMDMVGRLRENRLSVLGSATADEWPDLLQPLCRELRLGCNLSGDGYGPSDQTAFYTAGIPVLHFFTGAHGDYHKPSDTVDRINAAGTGQIAALVFRTALALSKRVEPLSFRKVAPAVPRGDLRSFNASLGTIPDYAGPKSGHGVLLAGVRSGGAAEKAGMKRGDVLIQLGTHKIGNVNDLMYVLNSSKPGETVTAVVLRDGKERRLEVTFQESKRH